jgi:hypothetical protein
VARFIGFGTSMIDVHLANLVSRTVGFEASGSTLLLVSDEHTPSPASTTITTRPSSRKQHSDARESFLRASVTPSNGGVLLNQLQTNLVARFVEFAGDFVTKSKVQKQQPPTKWRKRGHRRSKEEDVDNSKDLGSTRGSTPVRCFPLQSSS